MAPNPSTPKTSLTAQTSFAANADERFATPARNAAFVGRTWFSVTLAGILFLHLTLLAILLWRDSEAPAQFAKLDETPIEVVVEPPPANAPKAPEPPAAKPPDEKPASSAPRAANEEKTETDAPDKETRAPKAEKPVAAAPPQPAPAPSAEAKPSEAKDDPKAADADAPKTPDVLEKDAEALDKLVPEPPKKPAQFKAKPPPPRTKTALQQLAGSSELPDYTFAKPMRKHAKVTGGTEDDRYLAVVYGMITQTHHPFAVPNGQWALAVAFQVAGDGTLVGIQIKQGSGYPQVDAAAVQAVRSAAPFPPPPGGTTTGLVARLHSLDSAQLAGDR